MDIDELRQQLNSITGHTPIDNARRMLILKLIDQLQNGGGKE